jgi:hypothetical protein
VWTIYRVCSDDMFAILLNDLSNAKLRLRTLYARSVE